MDELFVRPDNTPMHFYLADLDVKEKKRYTLLIEDAGGIVENSPSDDVLMFTDNSEKASKYDFVFDVNFIDDCIAEQELLNIDLYYLGDERFKTCRMCKFTVGTSQCLCLTSKDDIFELVKNKKTVNIGSLKSIISEDNQETKQNGVSHLKKNASQEGNIEISKKLKQATSKSIVLDKNDVQNKRTKRNYIEDTDSETENPEINYSSPVLNKAFLETRSQIKDKKLFTKHRKAVELSKPSVSEVMSNEDYALIISSDEDENRSQKNSRKTKQNSNKVVTKEKAGSKKIRVENQNDSED